MASAVRKIATYDDLLALPRNQVGEILGGTLHASPRPAFRHARTASRLSGTLDGPFDVGSGGPGGWWLLYEPELHLGPDVLVPDLAGWRRERMPVFPDVAACELAPDWGCEILSPGTAKLDRTIKLPIYARERVSHAWIIDPNEKTLEAPTPTRCPPDLPRSA